jgi:hypothetical protein
MFNRPPTGTDLAIGLAAFLLLWYVVGIQINRRRARTLVRQVRESIEPFGGLATIRWIGRSAFRVEVERPATPFTKLALSVLLEPRETFLLWAVGRLFGRRDWLMVNGTLAGTVKGVFEIYHPRRRGALDSAHEVRSLGWRPGELPGRPELVYAAPGPDGQSLAREVMGALRGFEIWRVRVRNKDPQLSLSLPVPAAETRSRLPIFALLPQVAQTVLSRESR